MTRVLRADSQGPRIVPRLAAEAHVQATAILEHARSRAAELIAGAEQRAAELARAAEREARETAQHQAQDALKHAIGELARAERTQTVRLESEITRLARLAAEHLVSAELTQSPAAIVAIVRPLLERLRRAHTVTMHVHPEDAEALRSALASGALDPGQSDAMKILPRSDITRGGCVVVSDIGALDARIETRLRVVEDALNRAVRRHGE